MRDIFLKLCNNKQLWSMVYTIWMNAWAHVVQLRFLQSCVLPIIDYFVSRICIHRDFIIYLEISFTSHFFSSTSGKIEKMPPSFLEHSYFNLSLQEEFTSFWNTKYFASNLKFHSKFLLALIDWLLESLESVKLLQITRTGITQVHSRVKVEDSSDDSDRKV